MAKKASYTQEFLKLYKEFENVLTLKYGPNITVWQYENEYPEESKRIHVCRVIRNYIAHNPDSENFIPVPEELCNYLLMIKQKITGELPMVKDKMKRYRPLTLDSTLQDAAKCVAGHGIGVIVEGNRKIIGVITSGDVVVALTKGARLDDALEKMRINRLNADQIVKPDDVMMEIEGRFEKYKGLIVTSDGTSRGVYVGILPYTER